MTGEAAALDAAVAAAYDGTDPRLATRDLRAVIEWAILHQPRSLQVTIGPSGLGTTCDRCLIHMLAGTGEARGEVAWLAFIGTCVHAMLETIVLTSEFSAPTPRFLTEHRRVVGTVGGQAISGSTDVFDVASGTVIDYKVVGPTTITRARAQGASLAYQRQIHLYGKGWEDAGYTVESVAIWYLPRNAVSLSSAFVWQVPYDRTVAVDTLTRADTLASAINAFGGEAVLALAAPHTGSEFSCSRYADKPPDLHTSRAGHLTTESLISL